MGGKRGRTADFGWNITTPSVILGLEPRIHARMEVSMNGCPSP
ncbi:hypothetical protein ACVIOG_004900 [Rhizobium leguminosarum]